MTPFCLKNVQGIILAEKRIVILDSLRVYAGIENKIFYQFKIVLTLCYQYTLPGSKLNCLTINDCLCL